MKAKTNIQQKQRRVQGFEVLADECIWMKCGVVNYRQCDNGFDCNSCPFDKGMRQAMGIGLEEVPGCHRPPGWAINLREGHEGSSMPCRHALTGRIDAPKLCTQNYECYHCAFDQMLDELDMVKEMNPPAYRKVCGYQMAQGYYYHLGHSWARFEHGGRVRIGMDHFAFCLLGRPTSWHLPRLGESLGQNRIGLALERNGLEAAVLAPISGVVLAVNQALYAHPDMAAVDPYHQGWLLMMEPDMPKRNLKSLYFDQESEQWLAEEVDALLQLLGPTYERMTATGGEPVNDLFGHLPNIGWENLVNRFLRSSKNANG